MRRISHDLPGITQRIAKLSESFDVSTAEAKEYWKDDKGRAYFQQHTAEIRPTINLLVSGMAESVELFEEIGKRLRDPDSY